MIPTAIKGHMPFIPTNVPNQKIRSHSFSESSSVRTRPVSIPSRSSNHSKKSSPAKPNVPLFAVVIPTSTSNASHPCSSKSGDSGIARRSKPISLSSVDKEDVLKKDKSWRALLKAIFKSKGPKKSKDSKYSDDKFYVYLSSKRPHRLSEPPLPVHKRSNSLSMPSRNAIRLESIVEEELSVDDLVKRFAASSLPESHHRMRASYHADSSSSGLCPSGVSSSTPWSDDSDCSCESLHIEHSTDGLSDMDS